MATTVKCKRGLGLFYILRNINIKQLSHSPMPNYTSQYTITPTNTAEVALLIEGPPDIYVMYSELTPIGQSDLDLLVAANRGTLPLASPEIMHTTIASSGQTWFKTYRNMIREQRVRYEYTAAPAGPTGQSGSIVTVPGKYISTVIVEPDQTLQDAIDRAPASNTLVRTLTTPVDLGGNTYAFTLTSKPTKVFIDADELSERPTEFDQTTKQYAGPAELIQAAFVWAWDEAGSRILVHNNTNIVTEVVVADYVAILATSSSKYDAIDLRPGIFVHGINPNVSSIEATTARFDGGVPGDVDTIEYTIRAAAYSGIVGMKLVRSGRITPNVDVCGLLFPVDRVCDQFNLIDCHIEVTSDFASYASTSYTIGVFFACGESRNARAKNVVFSRTPMTCYAQVDVFETFSSTFYGLVYFIDSPVHGPFFIDGDQNTFKFINSPVDNQNTLAGSPLPVQENSPFAFNISGPVGRMPFPGQSYYMEFINSPIRATRTVGDSSIDGVPYRAFGWDGTTTIKFENSPISAELGFLKHSDAAYNAQQIGRLYAISSNMPPVEVIAFLPTYRTARLPTQYTKTAVSSVGATALGFGHFSMDHSELIKVRSATIQIRGLFANNTNSKTLTMSRGIVGALASVKTSTGPYQNAEFAITAQITVENNFVSVLLTSISDAAITFNGVFRQSLVDGQAFGLSFAGTGVANGDIVIHSQQITMNA